MKRRFYYYLGKVRPTDQDAIGIKTLFYKQIQEDGSHRWLQEAGPGWEQVSGVRSQVMLWLWGVGAASNSLAPLWGEEGRQSEGAVSAPEGRLTLVSLPLEGTHPG